MTDERPFPGVHQSVSAAAAESALASFGGIKLIDAPPRNVFNFLHDKLRNTVARLNGER